MNNYSVVLPSYSIGDNCLSLVEKICSGSGSKAVVVGGKTAVSKIKDDLISALANSSISLILSGTAANVRLKMSKCLRQIHRLSMLI